MAIALTDKDYAETAAEAMGGAAGPVLIEGFPRSIDNLATFEEQCGPCAALLFLDVPEETMQPTSWLRRASSAAAERPPRCPTQTAPSPTGPAWPCCALW